MTADFETWHLADEFPDTPGDVPLCRSCEDSVRSPVR
jgi:hypothetical protein